MRRIDSAADLAAFAAEVGMRPDWHEPDERDITARVEGVSFDNSGFWPAERPGAAGSPGLELHLIFSRTEIRDGVAVPVEDIAAVNLATLCAWACDAVELAPVGDYAPRHAPGARKGGADSDTKSDDRRTPGTPRSRTAVGIETFDGGVIYGEV